MYPSPYFSCPSPPQDVPEALPTLALKHFPSSLEKLRGSVAQWLKPRAWNSNPDLSLASLYNLGQIT